MLQKIDAFHKTKFGYLLFCIVELAIAYAFVSLSIDTGNLFYYLLTLIFFVGALKNLFKFVGKLLIRKPKLRS